MAITADFCDDVIKRIKNRRSALRVTKGVDSNDYGANVINSIHQDGIKVYDKVNNKPNVINQRNEIIPKIKEGGSNDNFKVEAKNIPPVENSSNDSIEVKDTWDKVLSKLHGIYGDETYNSWVKSLVFIDFTNEGVIRLAVPTPFKREWFLTYCVDNKILELWRSIDQSAYKVDISVSSTLKKEILSNNKTNSAGDFKYIKDKRDDNFILQSSLDQRFTFDNFVVGKPNELAFTAGKRIAESEEAVNGSNPLFLYGGVGLGKTHLMHAIGNYILKHSPDRKVVYLSAEKFMYQYIVALRNKDIIEFKKQLRSVDVLMVDDVQFISGKGSTQEEFFHTFNSLVDQKKQLIISADRSPSDLDGVEERIKSRLGWGLVADIHDSTFELRLGVLQAKVEELKVTVNDDVLYFIAQHVVSNIRELAGALNKVVAHSSLVNKDITVDTTREILADLLRANQKVITVVDIQKLVSDHFNVKLSDMRSSKRIRTIARPRQVAMYLSKRLTRDSLLDIGKQFGGKDHATVIHAVKKIDKLLLEDVKLKEDVTLLSKRIQN